MIVDANAWISAVIRNDSFYHPSRQWMRAQTREGPSLSVPSFAVVEVAGAVSRIQNSALRGRRVVRWMVRSPSIEVISMTEELIEIAVYIAADHRIRGADAIYVAVALEQSVPLVTWDRELRQRAAPLIEVIQP